MATETRVVYLLRHAKSDWGDEALPDHERPLNGRGRRSASEIAETIARQAIRPELVLVSTARRARETVNGLSTALSTDVAMHFEDDLYGATANELLDRIHVLDDDTRSVMLVGHNPAMEQLALGLARPGTADALGDGMKTATLVALAVAADHWSEIEPGTADLVGRWQHPGEK